MGETEIHIGLVLFPRLTQLDLTGPFEVFACVPNAKIHLVWKSIETVVSHVGLQILPTVTFDACPDLDVICIPGRPGVTAHLRAEQLLSFVRRQGERARYATSVCSGALVLGAAGLLVGYNATTHWASMEFLSHFGASPVKTRVCVDRNRITGGGVTAGIDFGLYLAAELADRRTAERIQLQLEYNPEPPFQAGHPDIAHPEVVGAFHDSARAMINDRRDIVVRAAAWLGASG
jgi:cyclohexyl-isocyanide hydratase